MCHLIHALEWVLAWHATVVQVVLSLPEVDEAVGLAHLRGPATVSGLTLRSRIVCHFKVPLCACVFLYLLFQAVSESVGVSVK